MESMIDVPEVKRYLDHCISEHLSKYMSDKHHGAKEIMMTEGVRDDVNIHNIVKGLGEGGGFGGFGGGGLLGGLLIGALLGNRNGGLFGNNGDGAGQGVNQITSNMVLQKLGDIQAAIPLASAQTENVILQQTNAITNLSSQAQLANAAGFAATKDAVQSGTVINLQATQNSSKEILEAICRLGSKIDGNTISQLQAELAEVRGNSRSRDVEVNVSQQVNQQQAQVQVQNLLATLQAQVAGLTQIAHATNSNIIAGNTDAVTTGPQSANPVNVRT